MHTVSVVIPAFNSEKTIARTLEAVLRQDYPAALMEVIVVDDGSADRTGQIVRSFPVVYLRQENAGPARARNLGWRRAQGEFVFFTDADCVPHPDWVARTLAGYDDGQTVAAVGGTYGIANSRSLLASCIHQEIVVRHARMKRSVRALGSYNLSVRRSVLQETGGFDESYRMASGEDNDLCYRIVEKGYTLVFTATSAVDHYHPESLQRYLRTQYWHGFWRVKLYRDHPGMSGGDDYSGLIDFVQPPVSLAAVVAVAFSRFPAARGAALAFAGSVALLQMPMAVRIAARTSGPAGLYFAWVCLLRAFSRGFGLVHGVVHFIIRKKR